VALLVGCGGSGPKPESDVVQGAGSGEDLSEALVFPEPEPYRMGVGDAMSVKFFYYPPYDFHALIRPDGIVKIPLVGEVKAAGMRPLELEELIRTRYSEMLAEPEVSVMITDFANQRVFVFGEVEAPGAYPLMGNMTVLDAIVGAGGFKATGLKDSVILMRKSADGRYVAKRVDIASRIAGRESDAIYLAATDVVYVPMSAIGKLDQFVDQFFNKITPTWRFYLLGREVVDPEGQTIISK
jgi:polysaccharide export outer membrane protein